MSDDERLAFHDRIGYALHYFGSESTDANPDDEIGVHEDRRSKINDYFYSTWGADPWEFELLDGTVTDTEYSDSIDLVWDEAHNVGIIINELPVKTSEDIADQLITTEFPETIPYKVEQHTTANFLKAGYGKIKFDYPDLLEDVVLDTDKNIPDDIIRKLGWNQKEQIILQICHQIKDKKKITSLELKTDSI